MSTSDNKKEEKQNKLKEALQKKKQRKHVEESDDEIDPRFLDQEIATTFHKKSKSSKKKNKETTDANLEEEAEDENKIDDRFSHMFTDKRFTSVSQIDKYGRKIDPKNAQSDLDKFYDLPNKKTQEEKPEKKLKQKKKPTKTRDSESESEDDEGNFHWSQESSEDEEPQDEQTLKKLLDEQSEDEAEIWEGGNEKVATTEDSSARLAMMNCDWNVFHADDIFLIVNSFLPNNGYVKQVLLYPSEYGLKMMEIEAREGPQGIWKQMDQDEEVEQPKKKKSTKAEREKQGNGEFEDQKWMASNQNRDSNSLDVNLVRRYEKCRQKFYYAVIEFDSIRTADHIYKTCDNNEYELSGLSIDLRFIPEDIEFPHAPTEVCKSLPTNKKLDKRNFISRADSHTNVNLSWEEPDNTRYQFLYAMNDEELDKADLNEYLASDSQGSDSDSDDGESDSEENDEIIKAKREQLIGKSGFGGDKKKTSYGDFDKKNKGGDIQITFKGGLELDNDFRKSKKDEKSNWQKYNDDKKDKSREYRYNDRLVDAIKKGKKKPEKKIVDNSADQLLGKKTKEELEVIADAKDFKEVFFVLFIKIGIQSRFGR